MSAVSLVPLSPDFECYAPTDPSGEFFELGLIHSEVFGGVYDQDIALIPDGGVVLDIGANVGLFTLRAKVHRPNATLLAFEPMPDTLEALRRNISLHQLADVTVYPLALGAEEETAQQFTYYPQAPGNSTRYPEDKRFAMPQLDSSTRLWIDATTASAVLARHPELTVIDLVKIDVEGAELEVLAGLSDRDWTRIRALVVEVDDVDGRLERIRALLEGHGFTVSVDDAPLVPEGFGLYVVHAKNTRHQ